MVYEWHNNNNNVIVGIWIDNFKIWQNIFGISEFMSCLSFKLTHNLKCLHFKSLVNSSRDAWDFESENENALLVTASNYSDQFHTSNTHELLGRDICSLSYALCWPMRKLYRGIQKKIAGAEGFLQTELLFLIMVKKLDFFHVTFLTFST